MTYGIIDRKNHKYYTHMSKVFEAISNAQLEYNWLITDCVCYPENKHIEKLFDQEICWLTGDALSAIIEQEDFQWIWGCLCGFSKDITLDEVLKYPLPSAENYGGYYQNPVSLQHPLSIIEIVPWDSSLTLIISKNKDIIDSYLIKNPKCEDLFLFNQEMSRLKIHGVKRELSNPFWVRFKKHYCPVCTNQLKAVKASKTVNSKSEEAKNYDFSSGDTYLAENIRFMRTEFLCTGCGKTFSLQEIRRNEKSAK